MRILRVGLVLVLLAAVSACGNGDDAATSADPTTPTSTTITSEPPVTTAPSTD